MILVFNALAWGFEHVPFDAGLIAALMQAFPGETVRFCGEREHLDQTQRFLARRVDPTHVTWRELALPPRSASTRERIRQDFSTCRTLLSEARRLGASRVIACYMHPTIGIAVLKALSPVYHQSAIAFVHHGSLLRLVSSRRYHPLLSFGNGRLRQIVLGDAIRAEVIGRLPRMRESIYAIRHPYFFEETAASELPESGPMTFSFLGLVLENKGFSDFVALARTIAPAHGERALFDLIGGTRVEALPEAAPFVKTYTQAGPMPRDLFERQLRRTTYAVLPYNPDFYKYIASGSVLDALTAGKPLIALRNSSFQEMFDAMGDIGYLCDNMHEVSSLVTTLLRDPPRERYRRQSENILAARRLYEPAAVAAQLREVLATPRDVETKALTARGAQTPRSW